MILGAVNSDLEATLRLTVRGLDGQTRRITAVIDSGSDGYLTLPLAIIEELGLPWKARTSAELADGSETEFDTYRGIVVWDRGRCPIDVDASESAPLVGTALLAGFEMKAQFRPGGKVTIKPLRRRRIS
jgi:clan AA aspartic protease